MLHRTSFFSKVGQNCDSLILFIVKITTLSTSGFENAVFFFCHVGDGID